MRYKIGDYVWYIDKKYNPFHKGKIIGSPSNASCVYRIKSIDGKSEYKDSDLIVYKLTFAEIIKFHIEKIMIRFIKWFY